MVRTYSNNNKIYSVDMMIAYINIYKPKIKYMAISNLIKNLEYKGWGNPKKHDYYSALDVINNKNNKKYKSDLEKIYSANLKYPIIVDSEYNVIDGIHRLTNAYLDNKIKIKVIFFSKSIIKKFLINNKKDWDIVDKFEIYDYIKLFYDRFQKN